MRTDNGHPHDLGVVIKKTVGTYDVEIGGNVLSCTLSTGLKKDIVHPAPSPDSPRRRPGAAQPRHFDPVAVGDRVRCAERGSGPAQIVEILPRRNRLARRSAVPMPGAHPFEQVIVANLDQVVPVFAVAQPAPHWNMLDRYLVSAESLELPVLICITKLDLTAEDDGLRAVVEEYRRIGYPVILTSARTGAGLEDLKGRLQGRLSVLVGKSGVGKSALLNALQPGLGLRVEAVNRTTGKGRHTTTGVELVRLETGGALVDTPGVREFGLWDVHADDLALFFPEMRPLVGRCRFGLDCRHDEEPACAIRKAVVAGEISPRRYRSFLLLQEESRFV